MGKANQNIRRSLFGGLAIILPSIIGIGAGTVIGNYHSRLEDCNNNPIIEYRIREFEEDKSEVNQRMRGLEDLELTQIQGMYDGSNQLMETCREEQARCANPEFVQICFESASELMNYTNIAISLSN
ncbi:MAG: hypothetical protein ABIJ18_03175 [archaeon]